MFHLKMNPLMLSPDGRAGRQGRGGAEKSKLGKPRNIFHRAAPWLLINGSKKNR